MVHQSQRSAQTAAPQQAAPQAAASEAPEWEMPLGLGNSGILARLFGAQADEGAARSLLEEGQAPETQGEASVAQAAQRPGPETDIPEDGPEAPAAPQTRRPTGVYAAPFDDNAQRTASAKVTMTASQAGELKVFQANWAKHRARYEAVAAKTGVPAALIAAIHYRESSLNWNTYLHQGDPLGRPAVHHPSNIPVFHKWEDAAIHALNLKKGLKNDLSMTEQTTDEVAMATYAEAYNGLGYHYKDRVTPYVYAGTDQYKGGMYVADGRYSRDAKDRRLGVLALVRGVQGDVGTPDIVTDDQSEEQAWNAVLSGHILRRGDGGAEVTALQKKLNAAGHAVGVDGDFGVGTDKAVRAFQAAKGLPVDGVVGPTTAAALDGNAPAADGSGQTAQNPEWARILAGGLTLGRGASGAVVKMLQELLKNAGFPVDADGDFGGLTERAVRAYQRARGLGPDGVVGQRTARALQG